MLTHLGQEEYVMHILKATGVVREAPGDLHVAMHMLSILFKLFMEG